MSEKTVNDGGAAEVQATVDKLEDQGFIGVKVDPTPNVNYTVYGVTHGLPTPETDDSQFAKAEAHVRSLSRGPTDTTRGRAAKSAA